jgi:tetratricopeptide (TPR) repeat protein
MKRYILFLLATLLSAAVSGQTAARTDSLAQHPQSEQTASAAYASDPDKLWDQANTAYINNDFPTAISLYETILSSGRQSGKLYYNLANAYFKEQEIGRAILNYNRALRLNPGNEDIRYNLQVAEKMTKDHIDAVPEFFVKTWLSNLRNLLSSTTWAVLSLVFLAAMLGSALFYLLSRRLVRRKIGFYGTATAFLLLVLTLCFAAIDRREAIDRTSAVVLRDAVAVKSSRSELDRSLHSARRHQSRNFGPSERLVRNHHRRRQKGLDGVLDVRNHLKPDPPLRIQKFPRTCPDCFKT